MILRSHFVHFVAACLALIVTLGSLPALASTIQQCVAEACKESSPSENIGDFLALEKSDHPKLEEFYGKYKSKIDEIRKAREKAVREAVSFLGQTEKVSASITSLSDIDLMKLLVEHSPWNTETDFANGKFIVIAEPLVSSSYKDQVKAIKDIFSRLQKVSSLYAAQLKADQLNMEPKEALGIGEEIQIADYVLGELRKNISLLPDPHKTEFSSRLDKSLIRLNEFKNQYGEKVFLFLGDIDVEVQVLLGKVPFAEGERTIIEKVMIDRIPGVIEDRSGEIAQLDKTYSSNRWEKTCKAAYNRSLQYGLTQGEKDRIENQMKPEALRRSEKALIEIFGAELTSKIIGFVNTMQIGGPLSLPEYVERMEKSMDFHLAEAKKSDRTLLEQYDLISSLSGDEDGAIESFCNAWIFNPLRDSVSGNSVILSSYSAKHYYVGLSIAIHEMAHAASVGLDLLKRRGVDITPFEEIRACISENYKDSDRLATYDHSKFHADKLWTEEDWADSFSGYAIKDLNVNDMCGFLGANPKHDFVTMAERSADTHSPTFYRILNIDIHLGNESPNQCKAPLESQYGGTKFKDCITPFTQKQ